jgi:hypothetical protein
MFCDYKINSINDLGNKVRVSAYFSEGEYQENSETHEMEYVRLNQIGKATLMFEKSPVSEDEINKELKRALEDIKGDREIIPECL